MNNENKLWHTCKFAKATCDGISCTNVNTPVLNCINFGTGIDCGSYYFKPNNSNTKKETDNEDTFYISALINNNPCKDCANFPICKLCTEHKECIQELTNVIDKYNNVTQYMSNSATFNCPYKITK